MKLCDVKVKVPVWAGVMGILLLAGVGGMLFSCSQREE